MAAPGSGLTATGLAVTVIAVSVGVSSTGGFALLLSFAGVLAGASLIFVGVRVADDDPTAPIARPGVLAAGVRVRALVHWLRPCESRLSEQTLCLPTRLILAP